MLAAGTMIDGKYRIVRLLGEGGMGEVYEAEHAFLQRRLAIKILNPEFTRNDDAVRRFYREAQAAGRVGHENICEVIDVGQTAGGLPYIVMQLLQGQSLAALIAESAPLSIGRTVDIVDQALAALHAAHQAGIVHRDIKPDNIHLISVGGRRDFVKLLDFGISKVRALDGGENVSVTRTGTVLGTPLYMSPEQARGDSSVDARTDVWSMGVIAYEMLLGQPPFKGDNYNQVLYSVLNAPIVSVRAQRDGVSRELDAVVMRALERDVDRRFRSAAALREAVLGAWMSVGESGFAVRASLPPDDSELLGGDTAIGAYPMPGPDAARPVADPAVPAGPVSSTEIDAATYERMATIPLGQTAPPSTVPPSAPTPSKTPTQERKQLDGSLERLLREAIAPVAAGASAALKIQPAERPPEHPAPTPKPVPAAATERPAADRPVEERRASDAERVPPAEFPGRSEPAGEDHFGEVRAEKVRVGAGREVFVVKPHRQRPAGGAAHARRQPKVEKTPGAVLASAGTAVAPVPPGGGRKVALVAGAAGAALVLLVVVVVAVGGRRSDSSGTTGAPAAVPPVPPVVASAGPDAGDTPPVGGAAKPVEARALERPPAPPDAATAGDEARSGAASPGDVVKTAAADAATAGPTVPLLDEEAFPSELPPEAASLSVTGVNGVKVLLDGSHLGIVPFESVTVPPGEHRLTFVHESRRIRHEETIEIQPGEDKRMTRSLAQLGGTSVPRDAGVQRDAAADGAVRSPADAARVEAVSADAPAVRIRRTYGDRPQ
ncbi:MAG: protein kinase [Deltaproteobacteria bacterium]|nr:protein kinase [Deltaproteobacteria bacterium]